MGYHTREIKKGKLGEFSKITEEYEELLDGFKQNNPVLQLCEIADLLGALEAYTKKNWNLALPKVYEMTLLTNKAFEDGSRTNSELP